MLYGIPYAAYGAGQDLPHTARAIRAFAARLSGKPTAFRLGSKPSFYLFLLLPGALGPAGESIVPDGSPIGAAASQTFE